MSARETKLKAIGLLVVGFPASFSEPIDEKIDVYELAVANTPPDFVLAAAVRFIDASVTGFNPTFGPNPAQFNTEAKDLWYKALDKEREERQRLAPPPVEEFVGGHTPESAARVAAMVAGLVRKTAEEIKGKSERVLIGGKTLDERTAERFAVDMSPEATTRRLGFPVYRQEPEAE